MEDALICDDNIPSLLSAEENTSAVRRIPPSIYFGGCAYGSAYYIGVYKAMLEVWGPDFADHTIICGDSAGIVMVFGITLKYSAEYISRTYLDTGKHAHYGLFWGGMDSLTKYCLKPLIEGPEGINGHATYKMMNNRVYIGVSKFFGKHLWTTEWASNDDLWQCMKNSLHIPVFCRRNNSGYLPDNTEIVDGAFCFAGEDLPHGDETMYVTDDPSADIAVNLTVTQMLFPSLEGKAFDDVVDAGYRSFMNWDGTLKKKVGMRKANISVNVLFWVLKLIEWIILLIWIICTWPNMFMRKKDRTQKYT